MMVRLDRDLVESCMIDTQKLIDKMITIKPANLDEYRAFMSALETVSILLTRLGALVDIANFTESKID